MLFVIANNRDSSLRSAAVAGQNHRSPRIFAVQHECSDVCCFLVWTLWVCAAVWGFVRIMLTCLTFGADGYLGRQGLVDFRLITLREQCLSPTLWSKHDCQLALPTITYNTDSSCVKSSAGCSLTPILVFSSWNIAALFGINVNFVSSL